MPDVKQEVIVLPQPHLRGTMTVEEAIAARRSRRAYRSEPLTAAEIGQLLWAAQGVTGPEGQRTAPSAGALYPLEVYISASRVEDLATGIYHYDPGSHALEVQAAGDGRRALTEAAADQDCVRFAPCTIIFAAVCARTAAKYGDRAPQYVAMEAAHASENVYLQAVALGLGTCAVGAFDPAAVKRVVRLPAEEEAVYLLTAGRCAQAADSSRRV